MSAQAKARKTERGDFQTPPALAAAVCRVVATHAGGVSSVLEPTCGAGTMLAAAARAFPRARQLLGVEIDPAYADAARAELARVEPVGRVRVDVGDFFEQDWETRVGALPGPVLVVGNPPWVTSAAVTRVGGNNRPTARATRGLRGLDAVTGKSNFDISEWMIARLVEAMAGRGGTVAMLCKTSVARKVLSRAWSDDQPLRSAAMYRVDAKSWWSAAVDACLLVMVLEPGARCRDCAVFARLSAAEPETRFGWRDGALVADGDAYARTRMLAGGASRFTWRSGIKHDCARVMELRREPGGLRNGFGEPVDVEPLVLYPMRKGSELAAPVMPPVRRDMIVTQTRVGEDTEPLARAAPRAWAYLDRHGDKLDARRSSIYRGRPRFSVFGVGDYAFAPWKVAIAGLYKRLAFRVVGPEAGRPVVFDDTCYFLSFDRESEARATAAVLDSAVVRDFFAAYAFWDAKRPITSALLSRLDIDAAARAVG